MLLYAPINQQNALHSKKKPAPKYSLLQYSWPEALPTASQSKIKNTLKKLEIENFSLSPSGRHLNVTVNHSLVKWIKNELLRIPKFQPSPPM